MEWERFLYLANIFNRNPLSSLKTLSFIYMYIQCRYGNATANTQTMWEYWTKEPTKMLSIKSAHTKIAVPSIMCLLCFPWKCQIIDCMFLCGNESSSLARRHKIMVQSNNEKLIKWKCIWQFQTALHTNRSGFRANGILCRYLIKRIAFARTTCGEMKGIHIECETLQCYS